MRREIDASAAVEDSQECDAFGRGAGRGTAQGEESALEIDASADGGAETVVEVGPRIVEPQRAAGVHVERRPGREARDESLAGAGVREGAAADGERTERTRRGLGRREGQRTRPDLVDQREGRVVEAHEAPREGRVGIVEANVQRRGAERAEDVAGTGEAAPRGVQVIEVEARPGIQDEGREARTRIGHAGTDAAGRDGEVGAEEGLGAEIEHAVAGLGDTTGGADDRLQGERRAERVDVGEAADRDRGDVNRVSGGAEVDAPFDERGGGDIGRSGGEAADADGQDAAGAGAADLVIGEGANVTGTVGTAVVERHLAEGVITGEDDGPVVIDGDLVTRIDGTATISQKLTSIRP